jgi:cellulose synthase/poly-beta-1,6-N-acetylglucosamine synthase-like glycosyltransferase
MSMKPQDFSALNLYHPPQLAVFGALVIAVLSLVYGYGIQAVCYLMAIFNIAGLLMVFFRAWLIKQGLSLDTRNTKELDNNKLLDNDALPRYTILLPLYRESKVLSDLIMAIELQDYPKDKLQVLLLLEADDQQTINALRRIKLPAYFQPVIGADSQPKTKPKACNQGLKFASGDIICVFDADDKPAPEQLRKVATYFTQLPENNVCIQCCLNFFNAKENWLTRMFEIEYRLLFDYLLPAASQHKWPLPLGGSSNHFKADFLHKFKWDSYNVTEDAEIGMRLAAFGFHATTVSSDTAEEAPFTLTAWLKQRSRWIKGYFITALIYSRHYFALRRVLSPKSGFFFSYMMILGPLFMLCTPMALAVSVLFWIGANPLNSTTHAWFFSLSLLSFISFYFSFCLSAHAVIKRSAALQYSSDAFLFPCYFLLHSAAAIIALYKIIKLPYYWEKTEHGLTKMPYNAKDL